MVFVDDGTVYSINDLFTERSLVFLAEDFTELMPLTLSSVYQPPMVARKPIQNGKKTPSDVWKSLQRQVGYA